MNPEMCRLLPLDKLFERQVAERPDAVAAAAEFGQLSYLELNRRSNQLAYRLRGAGIRPDDLVGICLDRSLEMIIAVMGTLKAGGAYVPLDPVYPNERLKFILRDAQIRALITRRSLAEGLDSYGTCVICLDSELEAIRNECAENPKGGALAENLAYVIYTSGSTGKPKGVLVSHAQVTRLFSATDSWFQFNEFDVWTLFHSFAFDFSVWEIWGALLYGGRLVVVPHLVSRSPDLFYELLSTESVTVLNQTPSAFNQLIQAEEILNTPKDFSLRFVIFGGEALEINSLRPWITRHGMQRPQLVNMYGITETTVHVTYCLLKTGCLDSPPGSMIGKPILDLCVYVLDRDMQCVPMGDHGEIYVGGRGVARGYLKHPDLTAERFMPDPYSSEAGARIYRSGDLARRRPDDNMEYLGRADHQVKIRGYRIELGEIEATIEQQAGVRQVAVVVHGNHLVAYVAGQVDIRRLRVRLQSRLPEYMVPSAIIMKEKLPLTANGKLDRQAMLSEASYSIERANHDNAFLEGMEEGMEAALAQIWRDVLHTDTVGLRDNFFDLGGTSLDIMQVCWKVRRRFNTDIAISELFEYTTISSLADRLRGEQASLNKTQRRSQDDGRSAESRRELRRRYRATKAE